LERNLGEKFGEFTTSKPNQNSEAERAAKVIFRESKREIKLLIQIFKIVVVIFIQMKWIACLVLVVFAILQIQARTTDPADLLKLLKVHKEGFKIEVFATDQNLTEPWYPRSMDYNPVSGILYVSSYGFGNISGLHPQLTRVYAVKGESGCAFLFYFPSFCNSLYFINIPQ
jgi:hypothetical protein